jgi:hypothetical protein
MPVFTFEKISPPVRRNTNAPVDKKHEEKRGVLGQVLDRFSGARSKRSPRQEQNAPVRQKPKG